jgi:hypothetical protein
MMQGLILDRRAPLYGRAAEILRIRPLPFGWLPGALRLRKITEAVEWFALLAHKLRDKAARWSESAALCSPSGCVTHAAARRALPFWVRVRSPGCFADGRGHEQVLALGAPESLTGVCLIGHT